MVSSSNSLRGRLQGLVTFQKITSLNQHQITALHLILLQHRHESHIRILPPRVSYTYTQVFTDGDRVFEYRVTPQASTFRSSRIVQNGQNENVEESKEQPMETESSVPAFFMPDMFSSFFPMSQLDSGMFEHNFASNFGRRSHPINLLDLVALLSMNDRGSSGTPPTSKETLNKLPTFKIEEKHCKKDPSKATLEPPSCAICCSDIELGQMGQLLPCGHMFHPGCTKPWLSQHNTCPVCRYELPTDDPEYEQSKCQRTQEQPQAHTHAQ